MRKSGQGADLFQHRSVDLDAVQDLLGHRPLFQHAFQGLAGGGKRPAQFIGHAFMQLARTERLPLPQGF
jgi:hypothetical protein